MKKRLNIFLVILIVIALLIFAVLFCIRFFEIYLKTKNHNNLIIEGKIGNITIFNNTNIIYIENGGFSECSTYVENYTCVYYLVLYLDSEAGNRFSQITSALSNDPEPSCFSTDSQENLIFYVPTSNCPGELRFYLEKKFEVYLNNSLIDERLISSELKGVQITSLYIYGDGQGKTAEEAFSSGEEKINELLNIQTQANS